MPFIAFYRKEYVEPELHINDLWRVWQWDEKVIWIHSKRISGLDWASQLLRPKSSRYGLDISTTTSVLSPENEWNSLGSLWLNTSLTPTLPVLVDPAEDPQRESNTAV